MEINNSELDKFLKRFCFFYDAVIREVNVSFRSSSSPTKAEFSLSARDESFLANNHWVNINVEFSFQENDKKSCQVLSNGLHILYEEGLLYFDFGFFTDKPNSYEFKESGFYVIGKGFEWTIEDYRE